VSTGRFARFAYRFTEQIADPIRATRGAAGYLSYVRDWWRYRRLEPAENVPLLDLYPQVHDRRAFTAIDAHYFYANGWAMRRITAARPRVHVDIASQVMFVNLLAAALPVVFVDYRPLERTIEGLRPVGANILALPFRDDSIRSLSSLHVAEHIGLGRYGDPLDAMGTRKAAGELTRVLQPGGDLLFAVPVGRTRVCFNAHRVHDPQLILDYFGTLDLVEFSAVDDQGNYTENADPRRYAQSEYACGLFRFRKRQG